MKYLQDAPFSVPVAGPSVSQEDWDAIFAPKCPKCGEKESLEPLEKPKNSTGCMACGHIWKPKKGKKS